MEATASLLTLYVFYHISTYHLLRVWVQYTWVDCECDGWLCATVDEEEDWPTLLVTRERKLEKGRLETNQSVFLKDSSVKVQLLLDVIDSVQLFYGWILLVQCWCSTIGLNRFCATTLPRM